MDGTTGVMLRRGAWHALSRFPVGRPHADIVLLTGRETQVELEREAAGGPPPRLTHDADYARLLGVSFRITGADGPAGRP